MAPSQDLGERDQQPPVSYPADLENGQHGKIPNGQASTTGTEGSGTPRANEKDDILLPNGNHDLKEKSQETNTNIVDWDGPDDPANPQNW